MASLVDVDYDRDQSAGDDGQQQRDD